jgi:PAS domain S-box-containing protein
MSLKLLIDESLHDDQKLFDLLAGAGHTAVSFSKDHIVDSLERERDIDGILFGVNAYAESTPLIELINRVNELFLLPVVVVVTEKIDRVCDGKRCMFESFACLHAPYSKQEFENALDLARYKLNTRHNQKLLEKRLFAILETQREAILTVDDHFRIELMNNAMARLLGLERSYTGAPASECIILNDLNYAPFDLETHLKSDSSNPVELWLKAHTGDIRVMLSVSKFRLGPDGGYVITVHDQTMELAREKELRDINFALDQHSIVAITDTHGVITKVNDQFCQISGYTREELIGNTHSLINSRYHSKEFFRDMWSTIAAGKIWKGEFRNRNKRGQNYWVNTTIVPIMNSDGRPERYIAIRTDITQRKSIEGALLENEFRYRTLTELTSDFVYCFEVNEENSLRPVWLTDAFTHITGYDKKELLESNGQHWENIIHPDDRHIFETHINLLLSQRTTISTYRIISRDGLTRWIRDHARPVMDETGGKIKMIIGAAKDITEMMFAEEAAERLLKFNESILKSAGEGIFGLDLNGIIAFINPAASNMLGFEDTELIGNSYLETFYHTKSNGTRRDQTESPIHNSLEKGEMVSVSEDIFWKRDGKKLDVEYISSPILSDDYRVTGLVVVFKDITKRIENERKINEARLLAERANRMKSEFLATMSHELRTPLNSIIGFSKLMKMSVTEQERNEFSGYILTSGTHLLKLINELLDLSKIEAGKMEFDMKPLHLEKIIPECISLISIQAQKKEIYPEYDPHDTADWYINGDEKRIKQVILNLLSNAVKFTGIGDKIRIGSYHEGVNMVINVTDTGIGIKKEDMNILFENFTQLNSGLTRDAEGTGLGLAITKRLVELHKGNISVQSVYGSGTTFTIKFPAFPVREIITTQSQPLPDETEYPGFLKNRALLIVDDDALSRSLMESFFTMKNQRHFIADSGKKALEILETEKIDVVVTDLKMPGMDGFELTDRIREKYDIPVVALSANDISLDENEDIKKQIVVEGFAGFLSKPVDFKKMVFLIKNVIEGSR